jgi:hypothetical protein
MVAKNEKPSFDCLACDRHEKNYCNGTSRNLPVHRSISIGWSGASCYAAYHQIEKKGQTDLLPFFALLKNENATSGHARRLCFPDLLHHRHAFPSAWLH